MSKINLNSEEFDSNSVLIFNDGNAGVAENVKVSVVKLGADKPVNYPDYQVKFTDQKSAEITKGLYHLDPNHPDFEKRLTGMGKELKHIWGNVVGKDVEIPEFADHRAMLDGMMKAFNEAIAANPDKLYRVAVSYGTTDRPQQYLRVAFYPPYFEAMVLPEGEESRITTPRNAQMTPFKPDERTTDYQVHPEKAPSSAGSDGW